MQISSGIALSVCWIHVLCTETTTVTGTAGFSPGTFAFVPSVKSAVLSLCKPAATGAAFVTFRFCSWRVSLSSDYPGYSYGEGALKFGKHIVTSHKWGERAGVWTWAVKEVVPEGGEEEKVGM